MSDEREGEDTKTFDRKTGSDSGEASASQLRQYFGMLADPRYRHILYYLNERRDEPVPLDEVARYVKAVETPYPPDTLVESEYADIKQKLSNAYLPRMADTGIIDYNDRTGTIRFDHPSQSLLILLWAGYLAERTP